MFYQTVQHVEAAVRPEHSCGGGVTVWTVTPSEANTNAVSDFCSLSLNPQGRQYDQISFALVFPLVEPPGELFPLVTIRKSTSKTKEGIFDKC